MNRRSFLSRVALTAAVAPLWVRDAFAAPPGSCPPVMERRDVIRKGLEAAKAHAKPLLVLVVPSAQAATPTWVRGSAFGQWLNHGGDGALADLAQVEVIAARCDDLAELLPAAKALSGDPLLVFVGTDGAVRALEGALASVNGRDDTAEATIDANIATLRNLLRGALKATREARAQAARALHGDRALPALTAPPEAVDAVAALLAERGDAETLKALAEAARKRLVRPRIPGSYWASSHGCGQTIEGVPDDDRAMVACGMGFSPARSTRFVLLYGCDKG